MAFIFSKKIKTAVSSFLLVASTLATPNSFAKRPYFYDWINFLPAGKITDLHTDGDLKSAPSNGSVLKLHYRLASSGCPSGTVFTTIYAYNYIILSVAFCGGDGTASFTYTSNDGRVCHITMIDGAGRDNASIQSADCDYSYNQKKNYTDSTKSTINQFELNTDENDIDISGM